MRTWVGVEFIAVRLLPVETKTYHLSSICMNSSSQVVRAHARPQRQPLGSVSSCAVAFGHLSRYEVLRRRKEAGWGQFDHPA